MKNITWFYGRSINFCFLYINFFGNRKEDDEYAFCVNVRALILFVNRNT